MSLQKICEAAKSELDSIDEEYPSFWSNLAANDVSAVLRIVSTYFYSVHKLALEDENIDNSKIPSQQQVKEIMGLFQELQDNFFPMAHSIKSLGKLRIVDSEEIRYVELGNRALIERLTHGVSTIKSEINSLESNNELLARLFNP